MPGDKQGMIPNLPRRVLAAFVAVAAVVAMGATAMALTSGSDDQPTLSPARAASDSSTSTSDTTDTTLDDDGPDTTDTTLDDDTTETTLVDDDGPGDISGPCDEAEHANDPRCTGVRGTDGDRHDNSGPGSVDDDDDRSGSNSGPG